MNKEQEKEFYELYDELVEIVKITSGILQWYDFDKIKPGSIYIWTKATDPDDMSTWGENVFDICSNEIVFYGDNHDVIEEAKPAIKIIQEHLLKMENISKR